MKNNNRNIIHETKMQLIPLESIAVGLKQDHIPSPISSGPTLSNPSCQGQKKATQIPLFDWFGSTEIYIGIFFILNVFIKFRDSSDIL